LAQRTDFLELQQKPLINNIQTKCPVSRVRCPLSVVRVSHCRMNDEKASGPRVQSGEVWGWRTTCGQFVSLHHQPKKHPRHQESSSSSREPIWPWIIRNPPLMDYID